eukprot:1157067-Pelagomonas_calceolata.AAC.5
MVCLQICAQACPQAQNYLTAANCQGLALCKPVFEEGLPELAWPETKVIPKPISVWVHYCPPAMIVETYAVASECEDWLAHPA